MEKWLPVVVHCADEECDQIIFRGRPRWQRNSGNKILLVHCGVAKFIIVCSKPGQVCFTGT
jgi:hypothetical protein